MDCPKRIYKKPYDQCLIERPYFKGYINKEYKESKTGRIGRDVECCKTRQCGNCKIYFYPSNIKKEDDKKEEYKKLITIIKGNKKYSFNWTLDPRNIYDVSQTEFYKGDKKTLLYTTGTCPCIGIFGIGKDNNYLMHAQHDQYIKNGEAIDEFKNLIENKLIDKIIIMDPLVESHIEIYPFLKMLEKNNFLDKTHIANEPGYQMWYPGTMTEFGELAIFCNADFKYGIRDDKLYYFYNPL